MKKVIVFACLALLVTCVPARADIVGGAVTGGTALTAGGTFVKLTTPLPNPFGTPDSVGNDNFQSPNLFAFDEVQNFTLSTPLVLNVGSSPIAAGAVISSHYVFFDPGPTQEVIGKVNFDSTVLGIITGTSDLASSDFLAAPGVNYLDPANRGLEAGDSVTISGPQQILFDTTASSPGDYVRVITVGTPGTTTTPEPSSAALMTLGVLGLAMVMGCKRKSLLVLEA
jgi:PEP-CTERM motif